MTEDTSLELVSVYSSPISFDAEIVKAMLADEDIPSTVDNANAPFPGISAVACQVMVAKEHEAAARQLVAEHEAQHRERVDREFEEEEEESEGDLV